MPDPRTLLQRAWLLLLQGALFLPFLVAKDCGDGVAEVYTGVEVYLDPDRIGLFGLLVLAVGALALSPWRGARDAAGAVGLGLRAWWAGLAALLAVTGPALAFLFEAKEARIGWYLHGGGWALTYLAYLGLTGRVLAGLPRPEGPARGPVRLAVGALLLAPPVAVALKATFDPAGTVVDSLGGAAVGYGLVLPLAMAGVAILRGGGARPVRFLWWVATFATLGGHVSAGVSR